MAEGLLRAFGNEKFEVFSAGTEATFVRPLAIEAMQEIGLDISGQYSKILTGYSGESFDYVITVCDQANESCPVFPGAKNRLHWSFPDPAKATGTHSEQLEVYRQVRDAMAARIREQFGGVQAVRPSTESNSGE
jgi:arsenate reductase